MKAHYSMVKNYYDEENYTTYVQINTEIGTFWGKAKADEEDQQCPSSFQGYEIALVRAQKKFAKKAIMILKRELSVLINILDECKNGWNQCHYDPYVIYRMSSLVDEKLKEISLWETRIKNIDAYISNRIKNRAMLFKRINKDKKD